MARIKIEGVIERLDTEFRGALEATIREHFPDANIEPYNVFRTFKRMISRKCSSWERIPDNLVEKE